ncbi:hypothetical protein Tco_0063239, partial [Tanacetum coccineum]
MDHESKEKGSFILKKFEYGNPEICLQDHAVVDSGCSSHMTGNKAYLSDYEDYNGGFVAFGSDPKGGKITRAWLKSLHKISMKKRFGKKESVSKQGRKKSKPELTLDDSTVFDDQDADHGMEYMETEEAADEGRQSGETDELNKSSGDKGGSTEELVSTAIPKT